MKDNTIVSYITEYHERLSEHAYTEWILITGLYQNNIDNNISKGY